MKKLNIGFISFLLIILVSLTFEKTNGLEKNEITFENLNSNQFIDLVKEKKLTRISQICTTNFCQYAKDDDIKKAFEIFKDDYKQYLLDTNNDIEIVNALLLKGFPITKIHVLD